MAKKGKILALDMSEASYRTWYDKLTDYYTDKGLSQLKIPEKIKKILDDAKRGWPHAPRDVETRIKIKSGYKWKSHNNLAPNAENIPNVIRHNEKVDNTIRDMYQWDQNLSDREMAWWKEREGEYEKEFEFNDSSDKPLLFQLLVEELTQRRLGALILKDASAADAYSKLMTESLKRMQDTQTKLGITREQRADLIDNRSGDVSSLSLDLDEKIRRAKDKIEEWTKDTSKQKFIKSKLDPINPLPPIPKIEALLGIDAEGNLGGNIQTEDMADIIEEAATIHDEMLETEEPEEKKKPSMREPNGNKAESQIDEERTDLVN